MRDIVNFKKSENVLQIGKFSNPPVWKDLANLTLDPSEIETIRRCRRDSCDFKMSNRMIERFRKEVSWSAPDIGEGQRHLPVRRYSNTFRPTSGRQCRAGGV